MSKAIWWVVLALAAAVTAAVIYVGLQKMRPEPQRQVAAPPAKAAAEPPIRYPIQAEDKPLPPLNASDVAVREALAGFLGGAALDALLYPQELVRRVVATIDNLPRKKLAPRLMPVKPAAGQLLSAGNDDGAVVSSENAARYAPYMRMVEAVDARKLVAVYVHFYPLFQQAYRELGYPTGYFNDRLVEVIDDLLAAPDVQGPVRLIRPKVYYQFADPGLEALPAGHKILIRIGAQNAAAAKAKLREIRGELTGQAAGK